MSFKNKVEIENQKQRQQQQKWNKCACTEMKKRPSIDSILFIELCNYYQLYCILNRSGMAFNVRKREQICTNTRNIS